MYAGNLSLAARQKDLTVKRDLYLEYQIPEVWIISPDEHLILVLHLLGSTYTDRSYTDGSVLSPKQFAEIKLNLENFLKW